VHPLAAATSSKASELSLWGVRDFIWRPRIARAADLMGLFLRWRRFEAFNRMKRSGLEDLIDLMGRHGFKFPIRVPSKPSYPDPGLIARDDVAMLKVNSQWKDRGMSNVDLLRGLVKRIVDHPTGSSAKSFSSRTSMENGDRQPRLAIH
jgi:hypothetical protein